MAVYTVKPYYLSGNPVIVTATGLGTNAMLEYEVKQGSLSIFKGVAFTLTGNAELDLSSLFAGLSEPGATSYTIIFTLEGTAGDSKDFIIYPGAVNSLLQRRLYALSKDIFELKLHPADRNFFLSTRSFGPFLFIPENELLPLKYYKKGKNFDLLFGQSIQTFDNSALTEEQVGEIDFNALRKTHFDTYNELVNVFDIRPAGQPVYTTTIVITEARPAKHFIRFQNSLLAFEKIAVDNLVDMQAEFTHEELQRYDAATGRFVAKNQKSELKSSYRASITARTNAELLWITDMLLSKEHYFIADRYEYPVLVKSEGAILQTTSGAPVTVSIDIYPVDTDRAFSPTNTDARADTGIFSDEFNEIFY